MLIDITGNSGVKLLKFVKLLTGYIINEEWKREEKKVESSHKLYALFNIALFNIISRTIFFSGMLERICYLIEENGSRLIVVDDGSASDRL